MPFTFFFTAINLFIPEKKKLRESAGDEDGGIIAVKAAAWAWYQRGAGSEGKLFPAFDVTRTQKSLGPSRYKLEAITMAEKAKSAKEEEKQTRSRFPSLLDSYEIESISKHFESLVEPGRWSLTGEFVSVDSFRWSSSSPASENVDRIEKKKQQKEKMGGIWLKHAPVCGYVRDMIDDRAIVNFRSPGKHYREIVGR